MGYQRQNDLKLEGMNETVSNLTQRVNLIERDLVAMSKVEKQANLSSSMVSLFPSFWHVLCCIVFCLYRDDIPPPFQTLTSGILERLHVCVVLNPVSSNPYTSSVMWMVQTVLVLIWKGDVERSNCLPRPPHKLLAKMTSLLLCCRWLIW